MDCIIIGIAGGSGSGKSTFTNKLKDLYGDRITVLYHDNYYRRNDHLTLEERRKINYDDPEALETDLLVDHLRKLKEGEPIQCPTYDYSKHNRKEEVLEVKPNRIVVVEGILALQNPELRDLFDIKIYVEADADERILRRVSRDVKERGRDLDGIIDQYLTTVKPMHYIYVEPTRALADIVINSGRNEVAFDLVKTKIDQLLSYQQVQKRELEVEVELE